jgi:hypothetical protein
VPEKSISRLRATTVPPIVSSPLEDGAIDVRRYSPGARRVPD